MNPLYLSVALVTGAAIAVQAGTGEYIFFECNPNAEWFWVQKLTGAPIAESIARMLAEC